MTKPLTSFSAALASLATASTLHAQVQVFYVDQTAPVGGNGTSWQQAFRDLQQGLDAAARVSSGDATLYVAKGTYRPLTNTSGMTFAFQYGTTGSATTLGLLGSLAGLRGPDPNVQDFVRTPTILSADVYGDDTPDGGNINDNAHTVLTIVSRRTSVPRITIDGFIAEGAVRRNDDDSAVTLIAPSGRVRVNQCTVRRNLCTGITIRAGETYLDHVACTQNYGRAGGGLALMSTHALVEHSRFESNGAVLGGGVFCQSSDVTCRNVRVLGNTAQYGGGIYGAALVQNVLLAGNTAILGGALYDCESVDQSTVVHNSAQWGGGMHSFGGHISHSLFFGNTAVHAGGEASVAESVLQIFNTSIDGYDTDIWLAFDASISPIDFFDVPPRFVDADGPDGRFETWQDNDYHLQPNSRAINRSNGTPPYFSDLDGRPRVRPRYVGGVSIADLGCYEYQPHCPADTNQDNGVTVDDLLAFLNAYVHGELLADVDDGSGTNTPDDGVTVEDLLYFLERYNGGC